MSKQQESQRFKLTSQNQLSPLDSSRQGLTNASTSLNQNIDAYSSTIPIHKVKHVYLQQQNTYGRFVPFLLLKDQLNSDLDSSGHSALHHMCSHNSEYLPLYLSTIKIEDPILNKTSKIGHTPLDVAGIYCRKEYVDLLLEKGANDNGNVDHWAIQGGNIYNWSGRVDVNKKHLIHWAAYNDMPEVLRQYYKQGANLGQKDGNDLSPIDLAVINKSYNSIKVLAELGYRAKEQLISQSQSKSIRRIFEQVRQTSTQKLFIATLKALFVPFFCILSWFLIFITNQISIFSFSYSVSIFTLILWAFLRWVLHVQPQKKYINSRYSAFHSDIIGSQVNFKSNHFYYIFLVLLLCLTGTITLLYCQANNYLICIVYIIEAFITLVYLVNFIILCFGVSTNLTHEQMFDGHRCKYLWKQIHYIEERKILMRRFNNPLNRGVLENWKRYLSKNCS